MKSLLLLLLLFSFDDTLAQQKQVRVIIIKAHPDEAEEYAGGTAALMAKAGHAVKFLSLTNGDVGHWKMTKQALAKRRKAEALEAGKRLGVSYEILDHHDGELEATVTLRKEVVKAIREWKADIVITFVEVFGSGHPDNMVAARTVREGAGLSSAPLFMPEIPVLAKRPIFLLMRDYNSKRLPHQPDIVIPIDSSIGQKLSSFDAHASQFYEFAPYQRDLLNEVPTDSMGKINFLHKYWGEFSGVSPEMKQWLEKRYGPEKAKSIRYAEEFEYAPFSRRPSEEEFSWLFPMLSIKKEN